MDTDRKSPFRLEILGVLAADGVGMNAAGALRQTARIVGRRYGADENDVADALDYLRQSGLIVRVGTDSGGLTPLGRWVAGRLGPRRPLLVHRSWMPH